MAEKLPPVFTRLVQDHARVFFFSLGKLWVQPLGTLLTTCVIGITLALPASLHVLIKNIGSVTSSWETTLQISLFLKDSVSPERGAALAQELLREPNIGKALYVSRAQALSEFRSQSGFAAALDLLDENPLPALVVLNPKGELSKQQVNAMVDRLAQRPEVEQAKLDQQWLERLYALIDIARRLVWLIAGLLAVAVVVIVGNTIRLDIENRRDEIEVMKLIGAPDGFIRRPFLYTGFWYGLLGGLLGLVFVLTALLLIGGPTQELSALYQSGYALTGLEFEETVVMFGGGILLGWLGAFWTVARHMSRIEPR